MEEIQVTNHPLPIETGLRTFFTFSDAPLRSGELKAFRVKNCPQLSVGTEVKLNLTLDLFGNGKKKNLKGIFGVASVTLEFDQVHGLSQIVMFTFLRGILDVQSQKNSVNPPSIPVLKG